MIFDQIFLFYSENTFENSRMGVKNGIYVSTVFKKNCNISKNFEIFRRFAKKKLQNFAKFLNNLYEFFTNFDEFLQTLMNFYKL